MGSPLLLLAALLSLLVRAAPEDPVAYSDRKCKDKAALHDKAMIDRELATRDLVACHEKKLGCWDDEKKAPNLKTINSIVEAKSAAVHSEEQTDTDYRNCLFLARAEAQKQKQEAEDLDALGKLGKNQAEALPPKESPPRVKLGAEEDLAGLNEEEKKLFLTRKAPLLAAEEDKYVPSRDPHAAHEDLHDDLSGIMECDKQAHCAPATREAVAKDDGDQARRIQQEHPDAPPPTGAAAAHLQADGDLLANSKDATGRDISPFAGIALQSGDLGRADDLASRAIERDPGSAEAFSLRGAARLLDGNLTGAKEDAKKALSLEPANKLAGTIAQSAANMERDPNVRPPSPSRLIRDFGGSSAGSLAGGRRGADGSGASIGGGSVASLGGERAGSASFVNMSPSNKMAAEAEGKAKIGDLKGAVGLATRAIEADKKNPEAYAVRAGVWNKLQHYPDAKDDANTALNIDPSHRKAMNARAFANNMTGHPREAQADAERALREDPRDAVAFLNLAMAQEALGELTKAKGNYEKAAKLDSSLKVFYDEFLKKHPEVMGGEAVESDSMKTLSSALRTKKGLGGAGLLIFGLGAAALAFARRRRERGEEMEHEEAVEERKALQHHDH
jgi:tetratricopeptide (TPR) repeat protein